MVHSWATDVDDTTVQPRWGTIGKQKIEDAGELCPERMKTVDDEILGNAMKFIEKAKNDGKPFRSIWMAARLSLGAAAQVTCRAWILPLA